MPQKSSVSCTMGCSIHAVMMQSLFCIVLLLLLAPNLSSAALPTVETLPPISLGLHMPAGVAVGADEKIHVAEPTVNEVHVYSRSGLLQGTISGLDGPTAVAVDSAGRIYIGNAGRGDVEIYSPDFLLLGALGMGLGEFRRPAGIAIDSAGLIYVVDGLENEVKIYNADYSFKFSFGSKGAGNGQFQLPTSIVINEITSEILIPDFTATIDSARVQVFDLNGVFKRSFVTTGTNEQGETVSFLRPFGIAVDTLDRIYITDGYQNVVTVYDTSGNYLGKLYDSNRPLRNPLGIAFAPGTSRLFVASLNTKSIETYGIDSVYGNIAISPQSHDFGSVTVEEVSATQSFDISNDGSGDLAIGAITLAGVNASEYAIVSNNCADTTLIPTAGCEIDVQFKPLTAGSKSASLSIVSDDIYTPTLNVALNGHAESKQYRLTVAKGGAGGGLVQATGIDCGATCAHDYIDGTVVSLLVLPNEDSAFAGWSGGSCTGTASCVVTMDQAVTVTAIFDISPVPPVTYSVTASASANGTISPVGTLEALENTAVTFSITADEGYHITEVLVDDVSIGSMDSFTFTRLDANHTIAAEFSTTKSLHLSSIEMGEVSVGHEWKRVSLSNTFIAPVVVVKPASLNDASPAVVRVRNVDAQGFDVRIQEWEYLTLDAQKGDTVNHAEEQVSYIVMEKGSYTLEDGTRVEAGQFDTDASSSFITTSFAQALNVSPIVMSSIVTYNNTVPMISQMSSMDVSGFGYRLQKEEINTQPYAVETVAYIAWEPSQGSLNGISFEVGSVADVNSQQTTAIAFSGNYTNQPLLIADLQTTNGGAVNLRWSDKSATGVNVLLDQEQSLSISTSINMQQAPIPATASAEDLGYLVLWKNDLRSHTLTVEIRGNGQIQAQGINCGTDCSEDYSDGAVIRLSAVAADGSAFVRWSGGGCSGRQSCVVTLHRAATVMAVFQPVYDLTVVTDGLGSGQVQAQGINCGTDCNETYYSGTLVTLSAVTADSSAFAGWSGGGCRGGMASCVVNMSQAATVMASFGLDADQDGLPDNYEEQYAFLNPHDASDAGFDQDGDGVTNLQEYQSGGDPTKEDSDRDGLSDKYEFDNNLDPTDGKCPAWVCGGSGGWRHAIQRLK